MTEFHSNLHHNHEVSRSTTYKIHLITYKKKNPKCWLWSFCSVCLCGFCWRDKNNRGADGDLTQTPLEHRQAVGRGCQSGSADKTCPCGWPSAKVEWWRTWCGGSWCPLLHSQSASSPRTCLPWWCCL